MVDTIVDGKKNLIKYLVFVFIKFSFNTTFQLFVISPCSFTVRHFSFCVSYISSHVQSHVTHSHLHTSHFHTFTHSHIVVFFSEPLVQLG